MEELEQFARGEVAAADLDDVLQHLDVCAWCARAGQARTANDVAALRAELTAPRAPRRGLAWALAAAAAVAVGLFTILLIPRESPPAAKQRRPAAAAIATAPVPDSMDPAWRALVERAVASRSLPFPADLAELQAPAATLRGTGEPGERLALSGIVIDDPRPAFTWTARQNATYVVFVFDGEREVLRSPVLREVQWTPPRDLPRGCTLAWQVEATRAGAIETIPQPPAPPALFRIVSNEQHRDLEAAKQLHRADRLLLAVLQARAGLRDEALASLRIAAESNADARRILDHETTTD